MRFAVIIAGGSGTRLWPLSRKTRPKQLLPIFGQRSLLSLAVDRLAGLIEPANIYIITNAAYAQAIRDDLSDLPAKNVIGEPQGRDTANAIGLAAAILYRRDPQAVMGVFTADHIIEPVENFRQTLSCTFDLLPTSPDSLITFGLKPTWPHTGLGYIQAGQALNCGHDCQAYKVESFKEKPTGRLAQQYCDSGQYYWNSGMFVWQVRTILDQLKQFLPDSYAGLTQIAKSWDSDDGPETFERIFPTLEKISIDYAVMEKAQNVIMVVLPCSWVDLGSWSTLAQILPADKQGNISAAKFAEFHDSKNSIAVSEDEHLLALIGLEDVIVVHSPEATLVCHKSHAQQVKDFVARLEEQGKSCL